MMDLKNCLPFYKVIEMLFFSLLALSVYEQQQHDFFGFTEAMVKLHTSISPFG